ncbi:hypothetical protein A8F94_08615 [Bacillus sp. FJAT-27225]|uniref:serine O-acetyltransferase n=1 Tax=Bacillus sp. FJAT-27225 TaxID=1743144 RepID=UPI00080C3101|nr:hypothetical protein [Bacillus sp. FJAT-27225]OCA87887.1 hypothetical protein A8F94_08615 [Bacillus sp. FJAT-27225]
MINSKKDYKYYLQADKIANRYTDKRFPVIWFDEIWIFLKLLRKTEYLKNCKKGFIGKLRYSFYRILLERKSIQIGFSIPLNVFGPGLSISHRGTIVVNSNAKIGRNCRVSTGVTIGDRTVIGDNVFIAPGVICFGGVSIADNIAIGANSVVNKSFLTPNVTIAGSPANIVNSNRGATDQVVVYATEILDSQLKSNF